MQVNVNHTGGTVDVFDAGADAVVTVSWTVSSGLDFRTPIEQTFALDGLRSITVGVAAAPLAKHVKSKSPPVAVATPIIDAPMRTHMATITLAKPELTGGVDVPLPTRATVTRSSSVVTFGGIEIADQDEDEA